MKEDEHILEKALEALKKEQIPPGPPKELVDTTLASLAEVSGPSDAVSSGRVVNLLGRIGGIRAITKFAAAAVLLITAGYAAGRASAPRQPDMEQLQDALEPAIRRNVVAQLRNDLQSGLATCYDQLSDELGRRHSQDMARFAAQTLDASTSVTSELLTAVVEAIKVEQTEERQWIAAMIEQLELEHRRDTTAIANLAVRNENGLQGVARLLSYGLPESPATPEIKNSDNPK